MAELDYRQALDFFSKTGAAALPHTIFVFGESYLRKRIIDTLVDLLIPDTSKRSLCVEIIDPSGGDEISEAIEHLTTFSFLSGKKVVILKNASLFSSGIDIDATLTKIQACYEKIAGVIEKGFAPGHYLVISEDSVDRRTSMYKNIKSSGMAIDCSVPAGDRKADREAQRRILSGLCMERLGQAGKRMDSMAFNHCLALTGYNIHIFMANIDKLIDYTGNRPMITGKDVDEALTRSRKDPIYEFTGAIAGKKADKALFYLYSLIDEGYHYLQLFSAIVNNVRRLLLFRGFIDSEFNKNWRPNISYDRFRSVVLSDIIKYDALVKNEIESRHSSAQAGNKTMKKKGIPKAYGDILIAKNPKNAYPIYNQLKNADHFTTAGLENAVILLSEADIRLKKSGQNPVTVIESLIFAICRPRDL